MKRRFTHPCPHGAISGLRVENHGRLTGFAAAWREQTECGWVERVRYETIKHRLRVVRRYPHGVTVSWISTNVQDIEAALDRALARLEQRSVREAPDGAGRRGVDVPSGPASLTSLERPGNEGRTLASAPDGVS